MTSEPPIARMEKTDSETDNHLQGVISIDAASMPWLTPLALLYFDHLRLTW